MKSSLTPYQQLVSVSQAFFGPATDRFLASQIRHHLNKEPDELTRQDIPKLVDWLHLCLGAINSDAETSIVT